MPFRFWDKVLIGDGCWEWQGFRTPLGYGKTRVERRGWLAHRLAWSLANGPIPRGMGVLHHCDNPPCVRPDHLFLGTQQDNVVDMAEKGRHPNSLKERCPRGHDYAGVNRASGSRYCNACRRERYAERKRAA